MCCAVAALCAVSVSISRIGTHPTPIGTGAQAAYDEARAIAHL